MLNQCQTGLLQCQRVSCNFFCRTQKSVQSFDTFIDSYSLNHIKASLLLLQNQVVLPDLSLLRLKIKLFTGGMVNIMFKKAMLPTLLSFQHVQRSVSL